MASVAGVSPTARAPTSGAAELRFSSPAFTSPTVSIPAFDLLRTTPTTASQLLSALQSGSLALPGSLATPTSAAFLPSPLPALSGQAAPAGKPPAVSPSQLGIAPLRLTPSQPLLPGLPKCLPPSAHQQLLALQQQQQPAEEQLEGSWAEAEAESGGSQGANVPVKQLGGGQGPQQGFLPFASLLPLMGAPGAAGAGQAVQTLLCSTAGFAVPLFQSLPMAPTAAALAAATALPAGCGIPSNGMRTVSPFSATLPIEPVLPAEEPVWMDTAAAAAAEPETAKGRPTRRTGKGTAAGKKRGMAGEEQKGAAPAPAEAAAVKEVVTEESKREKNRAAQKRFRDRKKARIEELEAEVRRLQATVAQKDSQLQLLRGTLAQKDAQMQALLEGVVVDY